MTVFRSASTGLPSRTSYRPALCFSSSVIFLLVDACVGLNCVLVSFFNHTLIKTSFIHSFCWTVSTCRPIRGVVHSNFKLGFALHKTPGYLAVPPHPARGTCYLLCRAAHAVSAYLQPAQHYRPA